MLGRRLDIEHAPILSDGFFVRMLVAPSLFGFGNESVWVVALAAYLQYCVLANLLDRARAFRYLGSVCSPSQKITNSLRLSVRGRPRRKDPGFPVSRRHGSL